MLLELLWPIQNKDEYLIIIKKKTTQPYWLVYTNILKYIHTYLYRMQSFAKKNKIVLKI